MPAKQLFFRFRFNGFTSVFTFKSDNILHTSKNISPLLCMQMFRFFKRKKNHLSIGVGAGKSLAVWRIFTRISTNLPEKFSGNSLSEYFVPHTSCLGLSPKNKVFMCAILPMSHVERQFIKIKQRWAPILAIFADSLPRISSILPTFSEILPRF